MIVLVHHHTHYTDINSHATSWNSVVFILLLLNTIIFIYIYLCIYADVYVYPRMTAGWFWPSRRLTGCWRLCRSSSSSLQKWPITFSWMQASL